MTTSTPLTTLSTFVQAYQVVPQLPEDGHYEAQVSSDDHYLSLGIFPTQAEALSTVQQHAQQRGVRELNVVHLPHSLQLRGESPDTAWPVQYRIEGVQAPQRNVPLQAVRLLSELFALGLGDQLLETTNLSREQRQQLEEDITLLGAELSGDSPDLSALHQAVTPTPHGLLRRRLRNLLNHGHLPTPEHPADEQPPRRTDALLAERLLRHDPGVMRLPDEDLLQLLGRPAQDSGVVEVQCTEDGVTTTIGYFPTIAAAQDALLDRHDYPAGPGPWGAEDFGFTELPGVPGGLSGSWNFSEYDLLPRAVFGGADLPAPEPGEPLILAELLYAGQVDILGLGRNLHAAKQLCLSHCLSASDAPPSSAAQLDFRLDTLDEPGILRGQWEDMTFSLHTVTVN